MATTHSVFTNPAENDLQKLRRERQFHIIEVPSLRLLGFSLITVLAVLRHAFVPDDPTTRPLLLGAIVLTYSFVSWAILYAFFDRWKHVKLGNLFLSLDVVGFVVAIYLTGADKSWLFFLLFIRVADQGNTTFRRSLVFAHLAVGLYGLLLLELLFIEHRAVAWPAEAFKLLLLYATCLYLSLTARTAERMRDRMVRAIRLARDLVKQLRDQSQGLGPRAEQAEQASRIEVNSSRT